MKRNRGTMSGFLFPVINKMISLAITDATKPTEDERDGIGIFPERTDCSKSSFMQTGFFFM